MIVSVAGPVAAQTGDLYFGASVYATGAMNSVFVHEVEVVNTSSVAGAFRLYWLPRNLNNSSAVFVDVPVESGQATRFDNILAEVFGLSPGVTGALRVAPSAGDMRFHSTVINVSDAGTYGQVMPAVPESAAFSETGAAYILHLGEDNIRRTNVFCVNTTGGILSLSIDLFSSDGVLLQENWTHILQPWSVKQLNQVFGPFAPVHGYLRVDTATPGGRGICLAAVVNNLANDPLTEPAVRVTDAAVESYVPYAAGTATEFTDVALFAPNGAALVRIDLLRTGVDNTVPLTVDLPVAGGEEERLADVLGNTFGHSGTGALRITALSGEVLTSSQTAVSLPTGAMLRTVPPVATDDEIASGGEALLIHLTETADSRVDLGAVNTSASVLDLAIRLHDADGALLGSIPLQLQPYGHDQTNGAFAAAGHPNVPDGFATVSTVTPAGSFIAYATVTDLRTGHVYHVSASPVSWAIFADDFESGDTSVWSTTTP
jgi:hypothetical protein